MVGWVTYDNIILNYNTFFMTTISVPLPAELEKDLNELVEQGYGSNKADVMRRALKKMSEDAAVQAVLDARKEPSLEGDLRELMKKIK